MGLQGRGKKKTPPQLALPYCSSGPVRYDVWTSSYFDPGQGKSDIGAGIIDTECVQVT